MKTVVCRAVIEESVITYYEAAASGQMFWLPKCSP